MRAATFQGFKGIGCNHFGRDIFIDDLVHKRRVGPVFKQPSDKIGQQITVRANGGVNATACVLAAQNDVMHRFAHAM